MKPYERTLIIEKAITQVRDKVKELSRQHEESIKGLKFNPKRGNFLRKKLNRNFVESIKTETSTAEIESATKHNVKVSTIQMIMKRHE